MKTRIYVLVTMLAICLLQSCISSLRPLYTEKDLVFDARLLGDWTSKDGTSWKIKEFTDKALTLNHKSYLMNYTGKDESGQFAANLVKLDGHLFLDLYPIPSSDGKSSFIGENYLPVHSYFKVGLSDRQVELFAFASQKLYDMLGENRIRLKHEDLDNFKVITASTEEIQQFVRKYAGREDLFEKAEVLKK